MKRRTFLAASAAAALPMPALAQGARVLKFIPEGNLANADPIWTTTTVARNHGYLIYDTLFGVDGKLEPQPQMCAGYELSDDKLTWTFHLRDGLKFHDGAPVRGADCVASIARWAKRDGFGQVLAARTAEMTAPDDRSFTIKLSKPYPLMLTALGKAAANVCFIMPERVAKTDAFTQITDFTGSGPFRFLRDEWKPGVLAAYARFDGYVPRSEPPSFTAGAKVANFDRIEWNIIPDAATSAAAMAQGEEDWWQTPIADLLPQLRRAKGVKIVPMTSIGAVEIIRFNMLNPPFDNVKMRQAILKVTDQKEYMQAAYGDETSTWHVPAGVFDPGSPADSNVDMTAITGKRDWDGAKQLIKEAGYNGERVVIIAPTDYPWLDAFCQVTRDNMVKLGLNVDYQSMDWGTLVQRRAKKDPVESGGWSVFCTGWEGLNLADPGGHFPLMGNGGAAWFGWYNSPHMEQLRAEWFDAPDAAAQKQATNAIQELVFTDVPYIPLGQFFQPAAMRTDLTGVLDSPFPIFWNAKKG